MDADGLKRLKTWFSGYTGRYRDSDADGREAYELKICHSLRVVENCGALGRSIGLDGGDIALAEATGLLHDIGRFEQFLRYRTFLDGKSENHAEMGVAVIRDTGVLAPLAEESRHLIITAVSCHNRLAIPKDCTAREELFCRLIRDADKIDIMGVVAEYYESGRKSDFIELNLPDKPEYSSEIVDDLFNNRPVDMRKMKSLNDFKLLQIGWALDLNFPLSALMIRRKRYMETIRKSLPPSDRLDALLARMNSHLDDLGANKGSKVCEETGMSDLTLNSCIKKHENDRK
jgi:hypothetical protein